MRAAASELITIALRRQSGFREFFGKLDPRNNTNKSGGQDEWFYGIGVTSGIVGF
jgi:hypothetical protein